MKRLSVLLIIIGIMIISYPLMEQAYTWYWQHKLLSEWENPVQADALGNISNNLEIIDKGDKDQQAEPPLTPQGEILGVLIIDSINCKLPIIQGLNATNLKIGIAHLEDTPMFGETGNTVIAGHRGHSYGRLLNRLNEVKLKDNIIVSTKNGDYNYVVSNIVKVKPEEIEILRSAKEENKLTIVTCDPVFNPTHRLMVQAKLQIKK